MLWSVQKLYTMQWKRNFETIIIMGRTRPTPCTAHLVRVLCSWLAGLSGDQDFNLRITRSQSVVGRMHGVIPTIETFVGVLFLVMTCSGVCSSLRHWPWPSHEKFLSKPVHWSNCGNVFDEGMLGASALADAEALAWSLLSSVLYWPRSANVIWEGVFRPLPFSWELSFHSWALKNVQNSCYPSGTACTVLQLAHGRPSIHSSTLQILETCRWLVIDKDMGNPCPSLWIASSPLYIEGREN